MPRLKILPSAAFAALLLLSCAPKPKAMWDTEADFRRFEPKVLELIKAYRADPVGPNAPKQRYVVNKWGVLVPYVGFVRYAKYISELDKAYPYFDELVDAYTFGEMELKLRDKSRKFSETEIAEASLRSMLIVYAKLRKSQSDAVSATLDGYVALEPSGKLVEHFAGIQIQGSAYKRDSLPSSYPRFEYRIKLLSSKGESVKMEAWKGKPLLVAYVAPACSYCHTLVRRLRSELKPGIASILVFTANATPNQSAGFEDSVKTGYPRYSDYDFQFYRAYGGQVVPVTMLINADGSAQRVSGNVDSSITRLIAKANGGR